MAVAIAKCKCEDCGKEFIKEKKCNNRAEADSWKEWAEYHITVCPKCWKESITEAAEVTFEKLAKTVNFPTIEGVSEKQIEYAKKLRNRYVLDEKVKIEKVQELLKRAEQMKDKLEAEAKTKGFTFEEYVEKGIKQAALYKAYIILNESNAKKLISELQ